MAVENKQANVTMTKANYKRNLIQLTLTEVASQFRNYLLSEYIV